MECEEAYAALSHALSGARRWRVTAVVVRYRYVRTYGTQSGLLILRTGMYWYVQ